LGQLRKSAIADATAVFQYENIVTVLDRTQSVRHNNDGLLAADIPYRIHHSAFSQIIQSACGLVEDEDFRIMIKRSSYSYSLTLSS
jgi:hypothetical protein